MSFTPETSLLIANKKLRKSEQEVATLRQLVNYTVAIIVAAGGRVEIPSNKIEEWSKREWRHDSNERSHVFTSWRAP